MLGMNGQKIVSPLHMFMGKEYIACPYCGTEYVRFGMPRYFNGNNAYDASCIYDIRVRGDVMVIPFYCEEGTHEWVVVLGETKGRMKHRIVLTRMHDIIASEMIIRSIQEEETIS